MGHLTICLFVASFVLFSVVEVLATPTIYAEWVSLNYTWDATHTYNDFIASKQFIPENCLLAGLNIDVNGDIFVTVPRWRAGIPATLNKVDPTTKLLAPYPSWDIQREGVSGDLQNVQSMTIDSLRRMWVIEVGRRNFFSKPAISGAAGLWLINLETNEVEKKYYFPSSIVSPDESFLNDVVVDEVRQMAFLSDAWGNGAIIAFDLKSMTSRRYSGPSTANDPSYAMIINGKRYGTHIFTTPTDGIALTPDNKALFYCQVQGTTLYRLPTAMLANFTTTNAEVDAAVQIIGTKQPSDGMKYMNGELFWGSLPTSTFYRMAIDAETTPNMKTAAVAASVDQETMQWIDTFAIDLRDNGKLWFTSNRLDLYSVSQMDFSGRSGANMRILNIDV